MENKFNINDLELFIKSFKYCYFLEGDDKTHKRLDDSLELIQKIRELVVKETEYTLKDKVSKLIKLMEDNTSTKWDFDLQNTFDCIVIDDGINEHPDDEKCNEVYTGSEIWVLMQEIKKEL